MVCKHKGCKWHVFSSYALQQKGVAGRSAGAVTQLANSGTLLHGTPLSNVTHWDLGSLLIQRVPVLKFSQQLFHCLYQLLLGGCGHLLDLEVLGGDLPRRLALAEAEEEDSGTQESDEERRAVHGAEGGSPGARWAVSPLRSARCSSLVITLGGPADKLLINS